MAGVLLALALASTACSSDGSDPDRTGGSARRAVDAAAEQVDGRSVWSIERSTTGGPAFDGRTAFLLEVSFRTGGSAADRRQVSLTAYDVASGRRRWAAPVCDEATLPPMGDPSSGVLVLNCGAEGVRGIELATGEERWTTTAAPELDLNVQVTARHVLLDLLDQAVVLDRWTGEEVLSQPSKGAAVLAGDQLVLADGEQVRAIGLDGAAAWSVRGGATWLFVDGERVVAASEGAPIRVLGSTGAEEHRWPALPPDTYPTDAVGGHLITYVVDGEMTAIDLDTDRTTWRLDASWSEGPIVRSAERDAVAVDLRTGGVEVRDVPSGRRRGRGDGTVLVSGDRAISVVSVPGRTVFWAVELS